MKKSITVLLLIFAVTFMTAQSKKEKLGDIPKGYKFVKASFNFTNSKTGDAKSNGFSILPVYGQFVAPNLSFALGAGYNTNKSKDAAGVTTSDANSLVFLGLSRQYKHVAKPFYLFLQEDVYYSNAKDKISDVKTTGFGAGLSPGFNYFMSNHLSIDVTLGRLGYDSSKPDYDGAESTSNFTLGFDMFNVGFGVLYSW